MLDDCVAMFENTKMHKRRRSDIMVIGDSIMNHQSWIRMNPNQIKCLISIRRVEKWKKNVQEGDWPIYDWKSAKKKI